MTDAEREQKIAEIRNWVNYPSDNAYIADLKRDMGFLLAERDRLQQEIQDWKGVVKQYRTAYLNAAQSKGTGRLLETLADFAAAIHERTREEQK